MAFLFWPDSSEKQALTNLRHLLHELRRAWPECGDFVRLKKGSLWWQPEGAYTLDLADFDLASARARETTQCGDAAAAKAALDSAARIYRGDLLPGLYADWVTAERERIRGRYAAILERLVGWHEDERDYPAAIRRARQLRQLEPERETTCARLMRLHLLSGDRGAALRVYQECTAILRQELARFAESREHLESALTRYDPHRRGEHVSLYAQDPRAVCLCRLGWTLAFLGRPGEARDTAEEALRLACAINHPHTEGYVLYTFPRS